MPERPLPAHALSSAGFVESEEGAGEPQSCDAGERRTAFEDQVEVRCPRDLWQLVRAVMFNCEFCAAFTQLLLRF
jgi:hypothetical protein